MTIDEAIKHCLEVAERYETRAKMIDRRKLGFALENPTACHECAAEHRQLAEWLTELKKAKSIIRTCNRVLGYLLECEIESSSTRHEVETLLKSITEYLSGGSENGS